VAGLASPGEDSSQGRDCAQPGLAAHDLSQHRQPGGQHPGEWGGAGAGAPSAAQLVPPGRSTQSSLLASPTVWYCSWGCW